ncbi:hypothetical protein DTO271D3_1040 [Paecilomyces variotii]|nr:hypothetical protein DTO271D3_1040 [Paecilomyces variotii]
MIPRHPTAVHHSFTVIHWWWWLVVCRASIRLPPLKPTWGSAQVKLPTRCHSSLVFLTCFLVFLPFVFAHPVRFLSLPPRCSCVSAVCSFPKPPVLLAFSPLLFSPLHPSIAERSHYRVSPDRQKES